MTELNKDYLIDNQPIGKKLFREFCAQIQVYDNLFRLIEAIVSNLLTQFFFLFILE